MASITANIPPCLCYSMCLIDGVSASHWYAVCAIVCWVCFLINHMLLRKLWKHENISHDPPKYIWNVPKKLKDFKNIDPFRGNMRGNMSHKKKLIYTYFFLMSFYSCFFPNYFLTKLSISPPIYWDLSYTVSKAVVMIYIYLSKH